MIRGRQIVDFHCKEEKSLPGPPPVLASTLRTSPRSPFPHHHIP